MTKWNLPYFITTPAVNMTASGVGMPLETTVLSVKRLPLLDQHSPFLFTYHANFETRYLIG
jgi:hypothetical protein